ncbi:MOB-like protein phocein [Pyxicephalus adspersus]|uniref:MOB-like protein phocein n=1 Tax=Pyxicephalus adspersus TaxID=30357 RepID=UPI003B5B59AD
MVMAEGTAVLRRNRPGTKAQDFYNWPDESFEEMDSTLAVQQYIQQNIRTDCSNIDRILEPPEGQDEGVWKYEHLRQFCLELNGLAVKLQCPAIDYTRHTLDGAACLLNSNKYFPSRTFFFGSFEKQGNYFNTGIILLVAQSYNLQNELGSSLIAQSQLNETFLCHRFTKFVMKYNLMSKDNLIVPLLDEEVQNSSARESEA